LFRNITHRAAFRSLVFARITYAINWYNVASVFVLVASELHQNVSGLGVLTSSFYLGVALFQLPGGIVAAKVGARKTVIFGMMLCSVAAFFTGLSPTFWWIAALRFLVGTGMAFVFAPGVTLMAKYYRSGSEGLGIGLYNAAFDIGGVAGLFGWAVVAETVGWRASLAVSGVLGAITAVSLLVSVPKDDVDAGFRIAWSELKKILQSRTLVVLSLALMGAGVGSTLVSGFVAYYLEQTLGVSPSLGGLVGGLILLVPIFMSPVGGRLYDRTKDPKRLLLVSGVILASGVLLAATGTFYGAVLGALVAGVGNGITYTVGFASARDFSGSTPRYESLSVAWVNSLSLLAGFWAPLVFSATVTAFGYPAAWASGALYTVLITLVVLALPRPDRPMP
jgi:MFS family permease